MKNLKLKTSFLFGLILTLFTPQHVIADDPDFLTFSSGYFDFNRKKDESAEFRLEYRSNRKFFQFKPFFVGSIVTNGMNFWGGGILIDVYFGRKVVLTPSFAPTFWFGETDDLDLGHVIEFRSQVEMAYRFEDRSRIGLSVSHYSNASLGSENPGSESFMLNYSVPFNSIKKIF